MRTLLSRDERIAILEARDGPDCRICLKPFLDGQERTFDHIKPRSKGGTWDIENLQLAHKRCNALKGDREYDENGNLPPLKREEKALQKAPHKTERPQICDTCMSGRILLPGEECPDCGSGPQPAVAPRALQVEPKFCDHSTSHCWLCFLGFIERKAAILTVVDAEYLNE